MRQVKYGESVNDKLTRLPDLLIISTKSHLVARSLDARFRGSIAQSGEGSIFGEKEGPFSMRINSSAHSAWENELFFAYSLAIRFKEYKGETVTPFSPIAWSRRRRSDFTTLSARHAFPDK